MGITFQDNSIQIKQMIEQKALQFLYEAGAEVESQAKQNSSVDSGDLKKKWKHVVDPINKVVKIGSPLEHAIYQEMGTGEWALEGKGRKSPWYAPIGPNDDQIPMATVRKYGFKVIHGDNGMDYAVIYGQKPIRPLYNAMDTSKPKIIRRAKTIFGG